MRTPWRWWKWRKDVAEAEKAFSDLFDLLEKYRKEGKMTEVEIEAFHDKIDQQMDDCYREVCEKLGHPIPRKNELYFQRKQLRNLIRKEEEE